MDWIELEDSLPNYYEVVVAEITGGELIEVWRASNGEQDMRTQFDTNRVYKDDGIIRWRYKIETE